MKTLIKICGLNNETSVVAAAQNGADMLGFVFVPSSPRYITPEQANNLQQFIPEGIETVGVMLHPTQSEIETVLDQVKLDYIQTDAEDFDVLDLKGGAKALKVYRDKEGFNINSIEDNPFALFEGPVSGVGDLVNILRAREACENKQIILAGGLCAENINKILKQTGPVGVDVSSGVEIDRGVKNEQKIIEFIRIVRAFDEGVSNEPRK